jgi:hypothetical protein
LGRLVWLGRLAFVVALAGELVLPVAFYWALKRFGEHSWELGVVEGLLVVLTSGVMAWILAVLVRDSIRGG